MRKIALVLFASATALLYSCGGEVTQTSHKDSAACCDSSSNCNDSACVDSTVVDSTNN